MWVWSSQDVSVIITVCKCDHHNVWVWSSLCVIVIITMCECYDQYVWVWSLWVSVIITMCECDHNMCECDHYVWVCDHYVWVWSLCECVITVSACWRLLTVWEECQPAPLQHSTGHHRDQLQGDGVTISQSLMWVNTICRKQIISVAKFLYTSDPCPKPDLLTRCTCVRVQ